MADKIDSPQFRGRELTLVGHSLGGLVIQSYIAHMTDGKAFKLRDVRQAIFFATPTEGSTTGMSLRLMLSTFFRNPQEMTLRPFNPDVSGIRASIRQKIVGATSDSANEWRIPIHAFCGMQDKIVPEPSARGVFDSVKSVKGTHFSIIKPKNPNDERYTEFVELLLDPGGHSQRFEIENYETIICVEPREKQTIPRKSEKNPGDVEFDNYATIKRTVRFSANNRCRNRFTIQYGTRKGGYVVGHESHTNEAPSAEQGRGEDTGEFFRFDFTPRDGEDYCLNVEIYKGFDEGERDVHFHLGDHSYYREMKYVLDLSAYVEAGYVVSQGPSFYRHPEDHPHGELCRKRGAREPFEMASHTHAGVYVWELQDVRKGIADIVWDVTRAKPDRLVEEPTIQLGEGETAVVGYGSLLSVRSIGKSLGREYDGPFVPCHIEGWRRSWDVSMPNQAFYYDQRGERVYPEKILYLNVRPEPATRMNCAVFLLKSDELEAMHHREWIYEPTVVTGSLRGVRVQGGDAIMYVARPEHLVHGANSASEAAVRSSYLRILEEALQTLDPAFRAEYDRSTDPVPQHLVIDDKLDPDRPNPWATAGHEYDPASQMAHTGLDL